MSAPQPSGDGKPDKVLCLGCGREVGEGPAALRWEGAPGIMGGHRPHLLQHSGILSQTVP